MTMSYRNITINKSKLERKGREYSQIHPPAIVFTEICSRRRSRNHHSPSLPITPEEPKVEPPPLQHAGNRPGLASSSSALGEKDGERHPPRHSLRCPEPGQPAQGQGTPALWAFLPLACPARRVLTRTSLKGAGITPNSTWFEYSQRRPPQPHRGGLQAPGGAGGARRALSTAPTPLPAGGASAGPDPDPGPQPEPGRPGTTPDQARALGSKQRAGARPDGRPD